MPKKITRKNYVTQGGEVVSLSFDEFLSYPFNARLRLVEDDELDEKTTQGDDV